MKKILTEEIAKNIMKMKGEARGIAMKQDGEYILKEKGKDGLTKVERELEKIGCPMKYSEISSMKFYPGGLRVLSLLAFKQAFNTDDEAIRNICAFQPKTSLVIRLFAKYFFSVPNIMKKIQDMWKKYWNCGKMTFTEYNEKEGKAVVRIEGMDIDPIWCRCIEGYLASLGELILPQKKGEKIQCKETKCQSRGEKYHEFVINF
ncbi:MAG: hypothetical protein FJZ05_02645 [Candidatus Nealsonbacteria bacterium]|nr:hypothetical protein [Candidatus Nealsonbacteria bacterium]